MLLRAKRKNAKKTIFDSNHAWRSEKRLLPSMKFWPETLYKQSLIETCNLIKFMKIIGLCVTASLSVWHGLHEREWSLRKDPQARPVKGSDCWVVQSSLDRTSHPPGSHKKNCWQHAGSRFTCGGYQSGKCSATGHRFCSWLSWLKTSVWPFQTIWSIAEVQLNVTTLGQSGPRANDS